MRWRWIGLLLILTQLAGARILTHDEKLPIEKSTGRYVVFRRGTEVLQRSDGSVRSGTLAHDCALLVSVGEGRSAVFRGGSAVAFNPDGSVSSGTLAHDTDLLIDKGTRRSAVCRGGTRVTFRVDGGLASATLASAARLLVNVATGVLQDCPAGSQVTFGPDGALLMATRPRSPFSLGGNWRGIWAERGIDQVGFRITQDAQGNLTFSSPDGSARSVGYFEAGNVVVAKDWGNKGTIDQDGRTIRWDNGSRWVLEGSGWQRPDLSGSWRGIFEARGIDQMGYRIAQDSQGNLIFSSPDGSARSSGYFESPRVVVAKDWGNKGTVSEDGRTILWDNGSRWVR